MATATKIYRVCGKEYEYCHTARKVAGIFRWQDVACSPEHGTVYLSKIRESRNPVKTEDSTATIEDNSAELYDVAEDEDDSGDFYEDDEEEYTES